MTKPIVQINRAPVLALWGAVVAERLGYDTPSALSLGRLRGEMAGLRKRLANLQHKALWGTRDEAIAAEARWSKALEEVSRSYGPSPGVFSIRRLLSLAKLIPKVATQPLSPDTWQTIFAELPIEARERLLARRPVAEVHRLRSQLPGPAGVKEASDGLFELVD